jgi:hypothetical protein
MLCHPLIFSCLAYFSTLKMNVTCSSEPWVDFHWIALHYIPEDKTLHNDCCENLRSTWWLTMTVWCDNVHVIWWIGPKFWSLHPPLFTLKREVAGSFKMWIPIYQTKGLTMKVTVICNKMYFEIYRLLWFNGMLMYSLGACGSIVGWGTMLQAGRLRVRVPRRWIFFFNWPNPSSRTMALGSTQPLTEISTRNLPGG